jgi:uncharacterized membrane protein (DUF485 family)
MPPYFPSLGFRSLTRIPFSRVIRRLDRYWQSYRCPQSTFLRFTVVFLLTDYRSFPVLTVIRMKLLTAWLQSDFTIGLLMNIGQFLNRFELK